MIITSKDKQNRQDERNERDKRSLLNEHISEDYENRQNNKRSDTKLYLCCVAILIIGSIVVFSNLFSGKRENLSESDYNIEYVDSNVLDENNVFMEGGEDLMFNPIINYKETDSIELPILGIKLLGNAANKYFTEKGYTETNLLILNGKTDMIRYTLKIAPESNRSDIGIFIYNITTKEWTVEEEEE